MLLFCGVFCLCFAPALLVFGLLVVVVVFVVVFFFFGGGGGGAYPKVSLKKVWCQTE